MPKSAVSTSPQMVEQRKMEFAELVGGGLTPRQAAKKLGMQKDAAYDYMKDPEVIKKLKEIHEENQKINQMTRERVQDIVMEAIEMGRTLGDPVAIIRGAQELNKMNGYYAPEEKKILLTTEQRRTLTQFDDMSDEEVAKLANEGVLDAEFYEVHELPEPEEEETA